VVVSTVYDQALYAIDLVAEQVAGSFDVGAGAVEVAQESVLLLGELWCEPYPGGDAMTEEANTSVDKRRDDAIFDEYWSGKIREPSQFGGRTMATYTLVTTTSRRIVFIALRFNSARFDSVKGYPPLFTAAMIRGSHKADKKVVPIAAVDVDRH
jgi:hypothetical protein